MQNSNFIDSLKTGFIDHSVSSEIAYRPSLLVNDNLKGKKVLASLERELKQCDEFWISVAFITSSGVATLLNTLIELEQKGVKGKILTSQYLNFTQPEALRKLLRFKNIELKIVTDDEFHSKGYIFKNSNIYTIIIGSSNLTASALSTNVEWNLKVNAFSDSELYKQTVDIFTEEYQKARIVDDAFINYYDKIYQENRAFQLPKNLERNKIEYAQKEIKPNSMQVDALKGIETLRLQNKNKALLISATGTGKTYLSAFDVKRFSPKKFLFIVHRRNIAEKAMETYRDIFGNDVSMGLFSGSNKNITSDFIFSTVQTISKQDNLENFDKDFFDYIVIDETHRAGAESYQRIMDYFEPKFMLGMTATPERTDGIDVFKLFDHNIAYEIRLHRALEENMLSPFHYYGITDLSINGEVVDDKTEFNKLTSDERVDRIIENTQKFGTDTGEIRGLIFCSRKDECKALSEKFNQRGFNTKALTGDNSEEERTHAIKMIESDDEATKLDYIFSVDIFNEGIDIPSINQVVMLRPTQSAIIFVQQMGRGLRKVNGKEYLTIIDFIGNYANNYLVPIALYGDNTYNKDNIRKLIASGSQHIPGTSTVNFDRITKEKIYESIDSANLQLRKDLINDYQLLKYQIGRMPMMIDFLEHGSRDPYSFVSYSKSYFNFVNSIEKDFKIELNPLKKKLLELFSSEINNTKRVEESELLNALLEKTYIDYNSFNSIIQTNYSHSISLETFNSVISNINFNFITERINSKLQPVSNNLGFSIIDKISSDSYSFSEDFKEVLNDEIFREFLQDSIKYALISYKTSFEIEKYVDGFQLYKKYSRKDVFRILNWESNPLAQNVGGYIISQDKSNCPIFVNYHKHENISNSTKYEDEFVNNQLFVEMSKSKRTLNSPDVKTIMEYKNGLRLPLFIKKSNDEGLDFYFMGDMIPVSHEFEQTTMSNDEGKEISVVRMPMKMKQPVEQEIFEYITN
jgi:superfamily II DNA or RNA helicase